MRADAQRALDEALDQDNSRKVQSAVVRLKLLLEAQRLVSDGRGVRDGIIIMAVVSTVAIGLLATRLRAVDASVTAQVGALTIGLTNLRLPTAFSLTDATIAVTPGTLETEFSPKGPFTRLSISDLSANSASTVVFQRAGPCTSISVHSGAVVGSVWIVGPGGIQGERRIRFRLVPQADTPSTLEACGTVINPLRAFAVVTSVGLLETIQFGQQDSIYAPSIAGGKLAIESTEYLLTGNDVLRLGFAEARTLIQSTDKALLLVDFSGTADSASLGAPSTAKDLMPTLLEHLAAKKAWALVYSSIVAAIGLIWGIRRFFSGL